MGACCRCWVHPATAMAFASRSSLVQQGAAQDFGSVAVAEAHSAWLQSLGTLLWP